MARNIAQNYRNAQLNTASPGQRVVLMYEGLHKELKKSKNLIVNINKDILNIEKAHNSISLSEQIILELKLALDMDKGGELAQNLNNLYEFWIVQLSEINMKKDAKALNPIIDMVSELKDTWREAAKKARQLGA
ncbi:MAG: flagellar export chaperone FliS [Lentisphaeraceae bacterium]|nr:flagellar export chaperone FliS [Lentisphaeraceae bacterium]